MKIFLITGLLCASLSTSLFAAEGVGISGLEIGFNYSNYSVTNHYQSSLGETSDEATRLNFPFGHTSISDYHYATVHTDALNSLLTFVIPENDEGGSFYGPSLKESKELSVINWDLINFQGSGKVMGEDSNIPILFGFQFGLGVIGIYSKGGGPTTAGSAKFHDPAVVWWGLNTGLTNNNDFFLGHLIVTYDWFYFMNDAAPAAMNGKRVGFDLVIMPKALMDYKYMHFHTFFKRKFDMEYLKPLVSDGKKYSEVEIGLGVSFLFMADEK